MTARPCKFCECNKIDLKAVEPIKYWMQCSYCGGRGPFTNHPEAAYYSWNGHYSDADKPTTRKI